MKKILLPGDTCEIFYFGHHEYDVKVVDIDYSRGMFQESTPYSGNWDLNEEGWTFE